MGRLHAISAGAVAAYGLSGCATMEAMLEVMAPVAEAYTQAAAQSQPYSYASTQPSARPRTTVYPSPGATSVYQGSGPAESRVPDVTRCVRYENYLPPGWGSGGPTRWFQLTNICGQEINVRWCEKKGNGPCSSMGYAATLSPGGQTESWFDQSQNSGIQWVACPRSHQGKNVHHNIPGPHFYCKVYN